MTRTYRSDLLGGLVMVTTFDVTEIFAARNRSLQRFFPVSYTHLDVYKRQSFWCEEESCSTATVAAPFRVIIGYPILCLLYTSRCV